MWEPGQCREKKKRCQFHSRCRHGLALAIAANPRRSKALQLATPGRRSVAVSCFWDTLQQLLDGCNIRIDCGAAAGHCGRKQLALRTGKLTLIGNPTFKAVG